MRAIVISSLVAACAAADPSIVAVSQLDATTDVDGPYRVEAIVLDLADDDRVELRAELDGDAAAYAMSARDDQRWIGDLPGLGRPGSIAYHVLVVRDGADVARWPTDDYALDVIEP